ncbi:leucine-rich repeat protein [Candidatus Dependentiae bacterium]|nr:leucine-rich repeat protein [Candidatus Dependentiae bacterium]
MLKKSLLFLFIVIFLSQKSYSINVLNVKYDSEWDPGIYQETVEINLMLPVITFMRAMSLVRVAKNFVKRNDFFKNFDSLPESEFKNELRRQYYLYKGEFVDKIPISFSVEELFNAGLLDENISNANRNGNLDLSGLRIARLKGLFEVLDNIKRPVKVLDLSKNELDFIAKIDFSSYCSSLEKLILSNNNISDIQRGSFDSLNNLEFIDLGQNYITYLPDFIFSMCKNLRKIDLSDNSIRRINKNTFWGLQDSLEKLNLADNPITISSKKLFKNFKKLRSVYF